MPANPTSDAGWQCIEALFERASELSATDAAALLDDECSDDPALRLEVEAMLRADRMLAGPLDRPLVSSMAALHAATDTATRDEDPAPLPEGTTIGAYRVLKELGHGGMGIVYLAERADGAYQQRVALKVVRGGLLAGTLQQRFLRERHILARLHHPHIAGLLDGGVARMDSLRADPEVRIDVLRTLGDLYGRLAHHPAHAAGGSTSSLAREPCHSRQAMRPTIRPVKARQTRTGGAASVDAGAPGASVFFGQGG